MASLQVLAASGWAASNGGSPARFDLLAARQTEIANIDATVTVAAIAATAELLDGPDGQTAMEAQVRSAALAGASFVVVPGPIAGSRDDLEKGESIPGPTTLWIGALARTLRIWIVAPLVEQRAQPTDSPDPVAETDRAPFLTVVLVDPSGAVAHKVRAIPPGPPLPRATNRGSYPGTLNSIDVDGLRVGILYGSDMSTGVMRLSDLGSKVVFICANRIDRAGETNLQRLAQTAKATLVVANRRTPTDAGAFVVDADGMVTEGDIAVARVSSFANVALPTAKLGLPAIPQPNRFAASAELADVGRELFTDLRFSASGSVACASCHQPSHAFSTPAPFGTGVFGRQTKRNVPSLLNVAYRPLLRWDGYTSSLENFVKYPMIGVTEMDFHDLDRALALVERDPKYGKALHKIFGARPLTFDDVEHALATYLRTLQSGNSRFDRFYYGGDRSALDQSAQRGLAIFTGKARCVECHAIGQRYALFSDFDYHDLGVGWNGDSGTYDDIGLGAISSAQFSGQFLTPSLRDVARTAPYMHDGSLSSLRQVIDFFDRGGNISPGRDWRIAPLGLSEQEKTDLLAFLQSLDGDTTWAEDGRPRVTDE